MSNLYHEDIYKFDEPVKSYWETTSDTNNKYNKLKKISKQILLLLVEVIQEFLVLYH